MMARDDQGHRHDYDLIGIFLADNGETCPAQNEFKVAIANTPWRRFMGLMGLGSLDGASGLLLERCSSIHMCFMRFPIDVIWMGAEGADGVRRVTGIRRNVRPWHIAIGPTGTTCCLEVAAGCAPERADSLLLR